MGEPRVAIQPEDLVQITTPEAHEALGITLDSKGLPEPAGLARLVRLAARRWGVSQKRELTGYIYKLLETVELYPEARREETKRRVRDVVIEGMIALRELEELEQDGQRVLLASLPRIVRCGPSHSFVLGKLPADIPLITREGVTGYSALPRWIAPDQGAHEELIASGLRDWDLRDWLGEPGYRAHLRRRKPALNLLELPSLWLATAESFTSESKPLSKEAEGCWVLTGSPGSFSGSPMRREGRWRPTATAPDGLWCGARPGHNARLMPALIQVESRRATRVLDLYSSDELDWMILSRGAALSQPEQLKQDGDTLAQTLRLPRQLSDVLRLLCAPREEWRSWSAPRDAGPVLAALLGDIGGLDVRTA